MKSSQHTVKQRSQSTRESQRPTQKPLQQRKAGFVQSELTLCRVGGLEGSRGEVAVPLPFWPPVPLPHRPQLQHTLLSCQTFALCAQSNSLFLQKTNEQGGRKEGNMVRGVKVQKLFVYLAGGMLFILSIANHNICNVSAKAGDYTLKTALFAWRQTDGFHRFFICLDRYKNTGRMHPDT